jgi:hypothetical protein
LITKPPVEVQKSKEEFVKTYEKSLKTCFGSSPVPPALLHYFKYLTSMNHDTKPDFSKLRGIFEAGIKDAGGKNSGKLEFAQEKVKQATPAGKKVKTAAARPDFNEKFGTPSRPATPKAAPAKRTRGEPKKYTEVDSDGEEAVSKKKAPKKKAAIVESEPELLDESEEEIIPASTKRNRDKKRKEESDEDEILEFSPKKKSRNAPADKPSKGLFSHDFDDIWIVCELCDVCSDLAGRVNLTEASSSDRFSNFPSIFLIIRQDSAFHERFRRFVSVLLLRSLFRLAFCFRRHELYATVNLPQQDLSKLNKKNKIMINATSFSWNDGLCWNSLQFVG